MNLDDWLQLLEERHPVSIDLGLDRCGEVYRRLGSPRPAKTIYTVAGTNGKGSTVAYIAAMSTALGQSCGTYTSPHISEFNERIRIKGVPVSDETLLRAFQTVEAARGDTSLTYFEFTTLTGFVILNQHQLDCAVLEVGLGGRLDTVNLVDADCVVITPIGLDHQDFLGPDIESIAAEKAGVIRPQIPVVCTESQPPDAIIRRAEQLSARLYIRGRDFDLRSTDSETDCEFVFEESAISVARPALAGQHQLDNLAAALAAVSIINPDYSPHAGDISMAIQHCSVSGRLQVVGDDPEILLDVGHNPLAAEAIASYLGDRTVRCVIAMLKDKPAEDVAAVLAANCSAWYCAASPGARGQTADQLASRIRARLPASKVASYPSVGQSIEAAVKDARSGGTVLVFGSFTTVSAAMQWLDNQRKKDTHDAAKLPR